MDVDADNPGRDCAHTGSPHRHGSRAAYVGDRCRCRNCRAANAAAQRQRHKAIAYGRWHPFVDATPAREHVRSLMAAGIGRHRIATLAALSNGTLDNLLYGNRRTKRPPSTRIRPDTASRILAITPERHNKARGALTDATGSRRRVQALAAIGWSPASLARQLDRSPAHLRRILRADSVKVDTADAIALLYEQLWNTPAESATRRRQTEPATKTPPRATDHRWPAPMAWDDIDNDEEPPAHPSTRAFAAPTDIDQVAVERAIAGDEVNLSPAERDETIRRLTATGHSVRDIAVRLGTTPRTVTRRRAADRAAQRQAETRS